MNERITQLALEASDPKTGWLDRKKFAELIVRECAYIGEQYADGNYEVPRQILARFGMDEE